MTADATPLCNLVAVLLELLERLSLHHTACSILHDAEEWLRQSSTPELATTAAIVGWNVWLMDRVLRMFLCWQGLVAAD